MIPSSDLENSMTKQNKQEKPGSEIA